MFQVLCFCELRSWSRLRDLWTISWFRCVGIPHYSQKQPFYVPWLELCVSHQLLQSQQYCQHRSGEPTGSKPVVPHPTAVTGFARPPMAERPVQGSHQIKSTALQAHIHWQWQLELRSLLQNDWFDCLSQRTYNLSLEHGLLKFSYDWFQSSKSKLSTQAVGAESKEGALLLVMYLHPTVDRSEQRSRKDSPCIGTMLT
jgi:hypothetical protein